MAFLPTEASILPARGTMRDRLIVALDVSNARQAQDLVLRVGEAAGMFKVGLQLFVSEGPGFVRELVASGHKVFLDLKLHDIPNTVAQAVKAASELRVTMLTVHGGGGSAMLRAAVDAAAGRSSVLAVTVLTSFNENDLGEVGVAGAVSSQVIRLAHVARHAGCQGIVTSPRETALVRRSLGEGFLIVNPGVRPAGAHKNDQQRTATPAEAMAAGASHIVVGRPITAAADPAEAARKILEEMQETTPIPFKG